MTSSDLRVTRVQNQTQTIRNAHSFPQYKLIRELGKGAMGIVYLAQHKQLNQYCSGTVLFFLF